MQRKWRKGALSAVTVLCLTGLAGWSNAQTGLLTNGPQSGAIQTKATGANFSVTGTQTVGAVGDCSKVTVSVTGEITGTIDRGGGLDSVAFQLWDDGELKDSETVSVPVGNTQSVSVTLEFEGLYGTGIPGVGIIVESGGELYSNDPFIPADVEGACGTGPVAPSQVTAVPTLSTLSLMLLGAGLAGAGGLASSRRRRRSDSVDHHQS